MYNFEIYNTIYFYVGKYKYNLSLIGEKVAELGFVFREIVLVPIANTFTLLN